MASMPGGDAATTPGGTGGRTRRASGFSGRGAGRRGAGTTGETAPDGRERRVSIRACNASSCAASRCVVAVGVRERAHVRRVETRRRVLDLLGERRHFGASLPHVCFQRARALGFACGTQAFVLARRECLLQLRGEAFGPTVRALRVGLGLLFPCASRAAFAAQLVGRARRVGLRRHPRRIRAPARLFQLGELLRAHARRVLVAAVAPFEPIERDHETEAELRTVGPARPQRRREQRQVTTLDRGRDEIPGIAVAPLREHAGHSGLRTEPGEHAVAEPFVFVERAAQ